ncbi:Predicted arabinose efflux permease, MFS family [Octadecabacter temperatus]|uniref:Major Facilitator Superfamily protein n=1 Tax=Octadecabacter temperatus TaxID=1458307 RepID=A0A0K0Y5C7_9RHOB|nr:MFS transporter [Octadecabacter temperatus]AKS46169.1 Major Facilitator Superfamily protein [Octadecabacter temperatus]SIO08886.1 Predicted arabinose efflux permease, MFS family [Octadecabacter temperatus]
MTQATSQIPDDSRAKRNVAVLVLAQAILGAQMPMIFVVGGLAGKQLASNICWATLPISLIIFGSMTTAPWLSPLMQSRGRRFGFYIGAIAGAFGAAVAAYGLYIGSFTVLLIGSYFTGIYMSAQGFYRFAATDSASDSFKPKAISYVMAGGLLSAILGPQLNKIVDGYSVVPFLGTYMAVVALNLIGMFLFLALDLPKGTRGQPKVDGPAPRTRGQLLSDPNIIVAMIVALVSYSLMNLVMTSTPLAVVGCGYDLDNANNIVSAHVLAMFAPSFFTGHLIVRYGVKTIMAIGLVILTAAGIAALFGVSLADGNQPSLVSFYAALILLGLGWNFGFIGATTLLTSSHAAHERGVIQGLNDMIVFGSVMMASLASGGLMNCSGGEPIAGWTAVNIAMAPFIALAAGALIWLTFKSRRAA